MAERESKLQSRREQRRFAIAPASISPLPAHNQTLTLTLNLPVTFVKAMKGIRVRVRAWRAAASEGALASKVSTGMEWDVLFEIFAVDLACAFASPAHCKHGGRQEQAHLQGQERWQKENVSNPALSVVVHVLSHCI